MIEARITNVQKDPRTSNLETLKGISDHELRKMLMPLSNSSSDGLSDNKASAHRTGLVVPFCYLIGGLNSLPANLVERNIWKVNVVYSCALPFFFVVIIYLEQHIS